MKVVATLRTFVARLFTYLRRVIDILLAEWPSSRRASILITRDLNRARESFDEELVRLTSIADGLDMDDVRRYTAAEAERRKGVDDKAKSNLMAITLGITVLLGGLNSVGRTELRSTTTGPWGAISLLLLIGGVAYLMFAGLMALVALRIAETATPSPADESGVSEVKRKAQLLWCLEQNQRITLKRTNSVSVSQQFMVNGIVCLAVLVVVIAVRVFFSSQA